MNAKFILKSNLAAAFGFWKQTKYTFFMGYVSIFMLLFCSSCLALASTWAQ